MVRPIGSVATIVAVSTRVQPNRAHSSLFGVNNYLRKSATYFGGIVRRAHCKGRALPAELSARAVIVADLPRLVNHSVGYCARYCARQLEGGLSEVGIAHDLGP